MGTRSLLILSLCLMLTSVSFAQVVLSEAVADNGTTGFKAPDGSAYDWIELHNTGASAVDLKDFYLTDLDGAPQKWKFLRSFIIPADGFRIIFASDRNRLIDGEEHTNFKLNSSAGEYLALIDTDGSTVLSEYAPKFPDLGQLISYGRVSGSATLSVLAVATPNAANSGAAPVAEVTNFTASAATIAGGGEVRLTWTTVNADTVELDAALTGTPYFSEIATVALNESINLSPSTNTTFRIRAINAFGSHEAFVEVGVGPEIIGFEAAPTTIATGGGTVLEWRVVGTDVTVAVNGTAAASPAQQLFFSPELAPQAADAVVPVTLTATNANGTTSATIDVTVLGTATPIPPIPELVISEFFWSYNGTLPVEPYQFFEIHNRATEPLDLNGIQLFGNIHSDLSVAAPRVLAADGYALIVSDPGTFAETWPGARPVIGTFTEPLPEGTYSMEGAQALVDAYGREIERVEFMYPLELAGFPDPAYRVDEGAPPTYPDNWAIRPYDDGLGAGTPGEANFSFLDFSVSPRAAAPGEMVTIAWEVSHDVPLTLSHGIGSVSGPAGSTQFTIPYDATELQFTLTAQTTFDTVSETQRVILPPTIRYFWSTKDSIVRGEEITMNYNVERGHYSTSSRIDPEIGPSSSPVTFRPLLGGFPKRSLWRYIPNGNGQGPEWRDVDFDHNSWNYGLGVFGYGNDVETTKLERGDYITAYFRKEFHLDEVDQVESLVLDLLIDDGAEIYLNGTEVLRELLPEGVIDFDTQPTGVSPNDGRIHRPFEIDVTPLVEGINIIAAGAHNNARFAADFGFDLGLQSVKRVPPDGRRNYTLTASNEAGTTTAQLTILFDVAPVGLVDWQVTRGLVGDPTSTDSDADTIIDVIEFATGSDPSVASPPPVSVELDEHGHLVVQFSRDLATNDIKLEAQTSTDLKNWYPMRDDFVFGGSVAPADSTLAATTYRSYAPVTQQRYVRLVASISP